MSAVGEVRRDLRAAHPVVADHDDLAVEGDLGEALRHIVHRDLERTRHAGDREFRRLAHVEDHGGLRLGETRLEFQRSDLLQHGAAITGPETASQAKSSGQVGLQDALRVHSIA